MGMTRRISAAAAAPISIERLVELQQMPHDDYLRTPEWRKTRNGALARAGWKCSLCSTTKQLQVHHNDYSRFGEELETDLTVVCATCHGQFHQTREIAAPRHPNPDGLIWKVYRELIPTQSSWDAASLQEAVKVRCVELGIRDYTERIARIWEAVLGEIVKPIIVRVVDDRRQAAGFAPFTQAEAKRLLTELGAAPRAMA